MEQKSTVLIVDDEVSMRGAMESLLQREGYNVLSAQNGEEALLLAAKHLPDVILLDVMMPEMTGYEVCQRIRSDKLTAEIPIIMVTALDDRDSLLMGLESGADDFISKPFDRSELRARVKTTTRLNRYRKLLSERTKFEWAIDQSNNGYLILNSKDDILYINRKARLYLGLNPEKDKPISGKFFQIIKDLYHFEPQIEWEKWSDETINTADLYLVRTESKTSNSLWLKVDVLLDPSAQKHEKILRLSDVTTQVTSKLSFRSFHNMVVHKMRTPFSGLISGLEILSALDQNNFSIDKIKYFIKMAYDGIMILNSEIEDIIQYTKVPLIVKSDKGLSLSVIKSIIDDIGDDLCIKSIRVSLEKDQEELLLILSQRAFESMIFEIFENSKKFHPKNEPEIIVDISKSGLNNVIFKFIDNGLTLSPDQLADAWTPYFQGEKYFTGNVSGMGLGLSMVASLIWSIGGKYSMYNRSDVPGVIVEISIPLVKE